MLLTDYVITVLLNERDEFGSRTLNQSVRLKHLESLWTILSELAGRDRDPFSRVEAKYKEPLRPM